MEFSVPRSLDADLKYRAFAFSNGGALKKLLPSPAAEPVYRECLKNHAASIGGHALDGCGEFLPSPAANVSDPASLKCAACGCHRNFHRRTLEPPTPLAQARPDQFTLQPPRVTAELAKHGELAEHRGDDDEEDDDDEEREIICGEEEDDEDEDDEGGFSSDDGRGSDTHPIMPLYFSPASAPNMLLALSSGAPTNSARPPPPTPTAVPVPPPSAPPGATIPAPKRFRSKFSPEQKKRMQELSERLGWRLQKRDEALVNAWCREIGVSPGVFKVWMHNNKHNFLGTGRRGSTPASDQARFGHNVVPSATAATGELGTRAAGAGQTANVGSQAMA